MSNLLKVFKSLLIISILSSCSYFRNKSSDNKQPQIRIVDLNGKPHPIKTRVPELNAEIMSKIQRNNNVTNTANPIIPSRQIIDNAPIVNNSPPNQQLDDLEKFDGSQYAVQNPEQNNPVVTDQKIENKTVADTKQNNLDNSQLSNFAATSNITNSNNQEQKANFSNYSEYNNFKLKNYPETKTNSSKSFKFSGSKVAVSDNLPAPKNQAISKNPAHGIFVQSGSFLSLDNANQNLQQVSSFHKAMIEESISGDKKSYRVLIGPFANKKQAQIIIKKLSKSRQKSFLVKK